MKHLELGPKPDRMHGSTTVNTDTNTGRERVCDTPISESSADYLLFIRLDDFISGLHGYGYSLFFLWYSLLLDSRALHWYHCIAWHGIVLLHCFFLLITAGRLVGLLADSKQVKLD